MIRMAIFLLFIIISSCSGVSPYSCPDIDDQFKEVRHKDAAHLDRKKNVYKKTKPSAQKRREFGTDKENLDK